MPSDRNALMERMKAQLPAPTEAYERLHVRRDRKLRAARLRAGAVGLAVTALIVVTAVAAWWPAGTSDAAGPAEGTSDVRLVAEPGEYYYVRGSYYEQVGSFPSVESEDGGVPTVQDIRTSGETWVGVDGDGRIIYEGSNWSGSHSTDETYAEGEMPSAMLPDLPNDPAALIAALIERGSRDGDSPNPIATTSPGRSQETTSLLRTIDDLLGGHDQFLTPEQVAALFRGAQAIEDVTTETGATDPLGREATRLSFIVNYNQDEGATVEWYFEPTTGQHMATVWVDRASGQVLSASIIEAAGIVGSTDDRPRDRDLYVPEVAAQPSFLEG